MAVVPEFISVLRKIRDVIYPEISTLYEDSVELKQSIDVGKAEFDADFAQFNIDYEDFNESKTLVDAAVLSAQASASSANDSAVIATNKSNEIKAITAQSTTGAPGTSASASYNPTDGKFTFVIPQGSKGDKGESFTVNSSGNTAQRALYDAQPAGWSFLDITTSTLYFKASNTYGDWSSGVPFGKGDKGDTGDTGVGIVSFTFISTTDTSGLPAQSGATDTYRVTLTNTNTFDYQVYNGLDASLTYVDEQIDIVQGNIDTVSTQISAHIPLSGATSYHLLQGNLAVSNSTITKGFDTKLYTGNGSTQSINTGIDMNTQWGSTAEEKFGGLVWNKNRGVANNHYLFDTIRGVTNHIRTDGTNAQAALANSLTAFNSSGFTLGSEANNNTSANTYASWNFQTTHRVSGTTNHGKAYTCHYNPFTGFTMVKYEGSGIAGHEIPHMLGRKLGLFNTKATSTTMDWLSYWSDNNTLFLNLTNASTANAGIYSLEDKVVLNISNGCNGAYTYIMYGWANSYFDEANKLIGNYEIGVYQGTGVAGNKVTTRGKPAWVMIKRLDSTGDWYIFDNQRGVGLGTNAKYLKPNSTVQEASVSTADMLFNNNEFVVGNTTTELNASSGQYLYMVVYDTNSNGGGSYYPLASDTANVQVNNALIPLAKGIDGNGVKNSIVVANETITGVTYTAGKNYLYKTDSGYGVKPYEPRYLKSELVRRFAGESPDYYDVESNKWFNTDAGSELVVNGTFTTDTVWIKDTGWTISGGTANYSYTNGSNITQTIVTTIGKEYKVSLSCAVTSGSGALFINSSLVLSITSSGIYNYTFVATSTSTVVAIQYFGNSIGKVDNVSCFPTEITPTTEIPESRNYMNHIVHADNDGGLLYVEELPKTQYVDEIKANEFKGKNACTAWVNFDGTTTPPTIRDSYNVSKVIRTATGVYEIYFNEPMYNRNYSVSSSSTVGTRWVFSSSQVQTLDKCMIVLVDDTGASQNTNNNGIQIFGGK